MTNPEITISLTAEFYDLDPMNIVWHGNYVKYFEAARCAFLDKIDFSYAHMAENQYAFPVVKMNVKYIKPVHFRQKIFVTARLVDAENFLRFKFFVKDENGQLLTTGDVSQICIDLRSRETLFALPQVFRDHVNRAFPTEKKVES